MAVTTAATEPSAPELPDTTLEPSTQPGAEPVATEPAATAKPRRRSPRRRLTFEEFLARADEDTRAEWVDGVVEVIDVPTIEHQRLMKFLAMLLDLFVSARRLGEVCLPPYPMRLATRPSGREPDVRFVAAARRDRLTSQFLDGPADLVIEIISEGSVGRDRGDKFAEHEAAGVLEYWLIDYLRTEALFYRLGDDGRYHRHDPDARGIYAAGVLPGFWLDVDWLWQDPLPASLDCLRQIEATASEGHPPAAEARPQ